MIIPTLLVIVALSCAAIVFCIAVYYNFVVTKKIRNAKSLEELEVLAIKYGLSYRKSKK